MGALVSCIKFMMKNGLDFRILELDKSALKGDELKYFIPQEEVADAIGAADNLIINGVILPKDTLEEILSLKKSVADAIVVSPTVSMPHKTLGVSCADGIYTVCVNEFLDVIAQADVGYHFRQICRGIRDETRKSGF